MARVEAKDVFDDLPSLETDRLLLQRLEVDEMSSVEIRPATPEDALPLAIVHIDSWRSAYRGFVPASILDGLDYQRRAVRFRESLASHAEETYVAEEDGEILGFLTVGPCRDEDLDGEVTGEIWGVYLAPQHWRKGIGTALCHYGEQLLRSRGYRQAVLWVFADNAQARRFYEAVGFAADGASKVLHPGAPREAVRYRKGLENTVSL
jgi:ribosomal protein S18 acetylase RimI-like enzyme